MQLKIPYGKSHLEAELAPDFRVEYILPKDQPAAPDPAAAVMSAVYAPLGEVKAPRRGQKVAIAINDKTRPVPHEHLLPPILGGIRHAGIADEDVLLIVATGTHPEMTAAEYATILPPEILQAYRVVCHDAYDDARLTHLGETSGGTPVYVNSDYLAADYRIVIGNIEPHQFQGFSGGVKSAAIGLAGLDTINHNHAMMREANAKLGEFEGNPARQDVEEIGRMIGIDFAVNAILNRERQIITAFAGDPLAVMQAGIPPARSIYEVAVDGAFDVMIVSPGGHPKDINIYQSQKGMAQAAAVTRDGGKMILCAACPEGSGNQHYEKWMMNPQMRKHDEVLKRFAREGFQVGRHKAFQISRDAGRIHTTLVSDLDDAFVRRLLLHPQPDLQRALDGALEDMPVGARIGVMPYANATMPQLVSN